MTSPKTRETSQTRSEEHGSRRRARQLIERLLEEGHEAAEVFTKTSRSRSSCLERDIVQVAVSEETGWAVRIGGAAGSSFACGSGELPEAPPLLEPRGSALRLPAPSGVVQAVGKSDSEGAVVLLSESESLTLLRNVADILASELDGARLDRAWLEDGVAQVSIQSSTGMDATQRLRAASLRLTASRAGERAEVVAAAPTARDMAPVALARRLADLLAVRQGESIVSVDRGVVLLAPEVGARLLGGLADLFVGCESRSLVRGLVDEQDDRIASDVVTIVDDGSLSRGPLRATFDGEGTPTAEVVLVDQGRWRQALVPWWDDDRRATGCVLRPSYRDQPAVSPTHLYFRPDPETSVGSLLSGLVRGYYWIDSAPSPLVDWERGLFQLDVSGFEIRSGVPRRAVKAARLAGSIGSLLRGVRAAGRDLQLIPWTRGCVGSPTLLVTGLEVRPAGSG